MGKVKGLITDHGYIGAKQVLNKIKNLLKTREVKKDERQKSL